MVWHRGSLSLLSFGLCPDTLADGIGFKSFGKAPFTRNEMCTAVSKEINFWQVKTRSHDPILGSDN